MNEEIKSFYMAIILSLLLIFATNYFFFDKDIAPTENPQPDAPQAEKLSAAAEAVDTAAKEPAAPLTVAEAVALNPGVKISTPALTGSLRTRGFRIDNLQLEKYKQTLAPDSPDVEMLMPAKTANPYYAEFGWLAADAKIRLPNAETQWTVRGQKLTPQTPVVLEWDNGQGLKFVTTLTVDENYMFNVAQAVENNTQKPVTLYPYGLIARVPDNTAKNSVVHEGLIGVMDDTLEEIKYDDLKDENQEFTTTGGWMGFSDRYWFSAIVLNPATESKVKFGKTGENLYQTDFVGAPVTIAAGAVGADEVLFYAGAKEIKLLDQYTSERRIPKFDLAVDFGWYYFLTKPFFYILDFLYGIIGNMGWAILLFAALLRLVMFPIANKSYESMNKMKEIQPKLKELQEKYTDKAKLQMETMELYRREKINPAAGCLPMLIQIPVFFSLYKVLNIAIEIRQAPFVGWIKDLSAPDPLTLSVITHLPVPGVLDIGVWPILMGLTMYVQQKLNPTPTSKDQARIFAMLPLIFMFMMGHFASGLVIYWTLSNILSIIQQKAIARRNRKK